MKKEIEARFIEVNTDEITRKALSLGGIDEGEYLLEETIFYDNELTWSSLGKYVRIRSYSNKHVVTYKEINTDAIDGAEEVEFTVDKPEQLKEFLEKIKLTPFRVQQKKRRKIKFDGVVLDIDFWPKIPPMLEIEGDSEKLIKEMVEKLDLDWSKALFIDPKQIIENYGYDVTNMRYFTFDRCE